MATQPLHTKHSSCSKPSNHLVQFYDDDRFLIESVGRFITPALACGGHAVVAATSAHCLSLHDELAARGLDADQMLRQGRLVVLDARQTLERFIVEGWPTQRLFDQAIGGIIRKLESVTRPKTELVVFGEMVALLWADGHREAAVELERLWNEFARTVTFSLFCAYPMSAFECEEHRKLFFSICGEHSAVNPLENHQHQSSEQRRRHVAMLEGRTRPLEAEIRLVQERLLLLQGDVPGGTWEMDLTEETVSLSHRAAKILHSSATQLRLSELLAFVHYSGDRDRLVDALRRISTKRCKEFVTEFRFPPSRVLSIRGKAVYNGGQPLVLGVISDVTPGGREGSEL